MYSLNRRDIPLLAFPRTRTFLSPFVLSPRPSYRVHHTSRPALSRGVHRSHECACIRIPAVQPLNLRPLCPPLISWNHERFCKQIRRIFAGDQNIFPPARLRDYSMSARGWKEGGRKREEFDNIGEYRDR